MARKFTFKILKSEESEESDIDLRVAEFTAHEWISAPYIVNLKLASRAEIDFNDVIAKEALLTIWGNDQSEERYFHGIINKFIKTGSEGRFFFYEAVMVPDMWRLTLMQDCRIFQGLPVLRKEESTPIVKQILKDANILTDRYEIRTQESYDDRDYCAQYRETDLNFISRILEEEGIFYFFEHSNDKHLLVFGDSTACYKPIPGTDNEVEFRFSDAMVSEEDFVYGFKLSQQIHSGKVSLRDFDFLSPSIFPTDEKEDSYNKLEIYDYPGGYIKNETANNADKATIKKDLAQIRLQEAAIFAERAEGESVCPRFAPGHTFTLTKHDEFADPEYVLIEVIHTGNQPQALEERSGHRDKGFSYTNSFIGIPSTTPFRPQRKTPKAVVRGPQTAIVVDSEGETNYNSENPQAPENVYTDDYGRVKIRFHWERPHTITVANDDGSSSDEDKWHNTAWVRVSQAWAGHEWGSMHIPHVGQEVIVDFLEGNPDRPIITGRVYNEDNQPHELSSDGDNDFSMKPGSDHRVSGFRDEYGNRLLFNAGKDKESVALGSPNNQSWLTLGKDGAQLKSDADVGARVAGAIIEAGCGFKLEGLAGAELALKLAQSYEFLAGQKFEFFAGNKIDLGFGTELEYKFTKELKAVEGDIENECKKDYKLTSGDGFCIVGGTRDDNTKNRSIINAFSDGIELSLGAETGTQTAKSEYGWWLIGIFATISALGGVFALTAKASEIGEAVVDADKPWVSHTAGTFTALMAALQTAISLTWAIYDRDSVEPSYHEKPEAVIGINKSGITLGIRPKVTSKEKDESEKWKGYIKNLDEGNKGLSKIMMKNDGSISINSNGANYTRKKVLTEAVPGSLKKLYKDKIDATFSDETVKGNKEIELSIGDQNNKKTIFLMDEDGVAIGDGKSKSMITVLNEGEILISAVGKDIGIKAGTGNVIIKGSKVDVAGSGFTKDSVDVLKSLKVIK